MIALARTRFTVDIGAAVALLAACGGSQPPIGAPGAMTRTKQNFLSGIHPGLYVANRGNNTVTVYRDRGEKLVQTISNGINFGNFSYLLLDKAGNLYCASYAGNTITVYPKGSSNPERTISHGVDGPRALALDASGNLYVANESGSTVAVYASGGSSHSRSANALS